MSSCVAIIPARGGSKGIFRKNLKLFAGKPLIYYSIIEALKVTAIDEVYVSTEDREIKDYVQSLGVKVIDRPPELASDESSTFSVLVHAFKMLNKPDIIITLQPTSPLRRAKHILEALLMLNKKIDTVVSVCSKHTYNWKQVNGCGIPQFTSRQRRQDMVKQYFENGSIYISRDYVFKKNDEKFGMGISSTGKIKLYEMSELHSIELDSNFDFKILEELYVQNKRK